MARGYSLEDEMVRLEEWEREKEREWRKRGVMRADGSLRVGREYALPGAIMERPVSELAKFYKPKGGRRSIAEMRIS